MLCCASLPWSYVGRFAHLVSVRGGLLEPQDAKRSRNEFSQHPCARRTQFGSQDSTLQDGQGLGGTDTLILRETRLLLRFLALQYMSFPKGWAPRAETL